MDKSIKFGADLINDVSGFDYDSESLLKLKGKNPLEKKLLSGFSTNSSLVMFKFSSIFK